MGFRVAKNLKIHIPKENLNTQIEQIPLLFDDSLLRFAINPPEHILEAIKDSEQRPATMGANGVLSSQKAEEVISDFQLMVQSYKKIAMDRAKQKVIVFYISCNIDLPEMEWVRKDFPRLRNTTLQYHYEVLYQIKDCIYKIEEDGKYKLVRRVDDPHHGLVKILPWTEKREKAIIKMFKNVTTNFISMFDTILTVGTDKDKFTKGRIL